MGAAESISQAKGSQVELERALVRAEEGDHNAASEIKAPASQRHACCCLVQTRCNCFCCMCEMPRWRWCCVCLFIFYVLMIPVVSYVGHRAVYPGAYPELMPSPLLDHNRCIEVQVPNKLKRTLYAVRCQVEARDGADHTGDRLPAILFGGNAMTMYDSAAVMSGLLPAEVSWDVFSMSMPGAQYGTEAAKPSDATRWSGQTEAMEDMEELSKYVRSETGGRPITVIGWSLGSAMAAGFVHSSDPDDVSCVVLGNPFVSLWREALARTFSLILPWLYLLDVWPVEFWARDYKVATIVLSSKKDLVIPPRMHEAVHEAVPSGVNKKRFIREDTGHMNISVFQKDVQSAVREMCSR